MDLDPDILFPELSDGETLELVFQATEESVVVVAQDPEEKPLLFVWNIPHGADYTHSEVAQDGGVTVSTALIPNDPVLDDSEMTCLVYDPGGNSADVTWHLVVE